MISQTIKTQGVRGSNLATAQQDRFFKLCRYYNDSVWIPVASHRSMINAQYLSTEFPLGGAMISSGRPGHWQNAESIGKLESVQRLVAVGKAESQTDTRLKAFLLSKEGIVMHGLK
jgi:hypothetical protein